MSTGTDIEVRQPRPQANAAALPAKVEYARELANSGLLSAAYRKQPGNILYAVEYGEMLGLAPMAAITGVHVIEGKPTASAGLISALVRRAGHKLRVKGDGKSAVCQIIRADDPDFTFEVTWTLRKNADGNPSAEEAGLANKSVWRNYPASMLKSRAITQCARDACEEALFGLHYTPEELGAEVDEDGVVIGRDPFRPVPSAEGDAYAAGYQAAEDTAQETHEAEVVPTPEQEWLAAALTATPGHASLDACGAVWARVVEYVNNGKLTKAEGGRLQDALRVRIGELKAPGTATEAEAAPSGTLDAEDPWAEKIADLADESEAVAARDEVAALFGAGELTAERADRIDVAILARFPGANRNPEAFADARAGALENAQAA